MEITLESDLVLLRPIQESDAEEIWANTSEDDQLWNWVWSAEPIPHSPEDVRRVIKAMKVRDAQGTRNTFAVVLKSSGQVIGSTSYIDRNEVKKSLEIGSTFYAAFARRTAVNTHCKYLLLRHAFEVLGYQRVLIKADSTNATSIRAITRIGAKLEGVIQNEKQRRDGTWRDAVYFSVMEPDWLETKAHLEMLMAR
ncbi:MAG: GNAT family N-acetyltransferase [Actinobacteria bacterium]|nr:GNAT family N-acetyltransferase [Actinomycetota bacterium]